MDQRTSYRKYKLNRPNNSDTIGSTLFMSGDGEYSFLPFTLFSGRLPQTPALCLS
jgi:hypothetical protein